jgi:hypothetical protein
MTKIIRRANPAAARPIRADVYVGDPCGHCGGNVRRVTNRTCMTCQGRKVIIEAAHSIRSHREDRAPC